MYCAYLVHEEILRCHPLDLKLQISVSPHVGVRYRAFCCLSWAHCAALAVLELELRDPRACLGARIKGLLNSAGLLLLYYYWSRRWDLMYICYRWAMEMREMDVQKKNQSVAESVFVTSPSGCGMVPSRSSEVLGSSHDWVALLTGLNLWCKLCIFRYLGSVAHQR